MTTSAAEIRDPASELRKASGSLKERIWQISGNRRILCRIRRIRFTSDFLYTLCSLGRHSGFQT